MKNKLETFLHVLGTFFKRRNKIFSEGFRYHKNILGSVQEEVIEQEILDSNEYKSNLEPIIW